MKITITRSFSKKVQLKQFEPVDSFCSVQGELEVGDEIGLTEADALAMAKLSGYLDEFARKEVDKTLVGLRPQYLNVKGKSPSEKEEISKADAERDAGLDFPET